MRAENERTSNIAIGADYKNSMPMLASAADYEHNARSGGTPAAPREKDLVWRLVAGGVG